MPILINRGDIVAALRDYIRTNVTDFALVKPYHGELDRYSKKVQLKKEIFPAEVNLQTPFALVISKGRHRVEGKGPSVRFRHDLSIYVGTANQHDLNSQEVPTIFSLLDKCVNALQGKSFLHGCGILEVENDGEFLLTTDLYTVYDQRYYQYEIGT